VVFDEDLEDEPNEAEMPKEAQIYVFDDEEGEELEE
jgi:hypothetical protein